MEIKTTKKIYDDYRKALYMSQSMNIDIESTKKWVSYDDLINMLTEWERISEEAELTTQALTYKAIKHDLLTEENEKK